ncbi:MAG: tetratricopeptide repeat protein [Alphaproteobacteria bacterium]|nr:tetratricopeptide repeat protein [Alphaproteobacteria bacterium]MBR3662718.1 tetratricopeptide repeat protein [Alphaproteobacteria bacterium]
MENLEQQASVLFAKKEYEKALEIYTLLFQGNPKNENYAIFCGNCHDSLGNKEKAAEFYENALKINKKSETALLNMSTINYEIGNYDEAEDYAQQVLKINPKNVAAWQNLGNISFCRADYEHALSYYQEMYQNNPNSYIAMVNLANTYFSLGKYVLALDFAKKSLVKIPSSVVANMIAGNSLSEMGKYAKAITYFGAAYELDENNIDAVNALSDAYRYLSEWESCMGCAWKYIKKCGDESSTANLNFGYLLYECYSEHDAELAKKYAEKWLKRFPENKIAQHMGNAIVNGKALQNSDEEYIKVTFDSFAKDFDSTLAGLEYQAPDLICEELKKHIKTSIFTKYHILDLGCGTGLCGEKIKKFASFRGLIGVDLSEKMLEQAEAKEIYSQLVCDDLCHYLETSGYLFDVMVASDVWTYFGDLTKAFVRVSKSLTPDGVFVFTVSENFVNNDDFYMVPSGRFVHTANYVERVLKSSGLKMLGCERKILRNEAEQPVYGYVIAAKKPNLSQKPVA